MKLESPLRESLISSHPLETSIEHLKIPQKAQNGRRRLGKLTA